MGKFDTYPFAYIRKSIVPIEQAQIPIATNALHYGAGIFGGIKAYETDAGVQIFRLADHMERMRQSCKILRFPYDFNIESTQKIILKLAAKNNLKGTTYIRPLVYRSDTNLSPGIEGDYDLSVYMIQMPEYFQAEKGLSVCVSSWQRNADGALPPRTKATGGYLNSSLAIHDAVTSGFDSAILLDSDGNVGEGAVMNLFMVKNGQLITPASDSDILEGITRRTVQLIAKDIGIPVIERTISRTELYTADEIFFCGTAVEISWCQSVDNVEISSKKGDITTKIHKAFDGLSLSHPELFTKI
ncbi:MAG: branched-chain amino acid transaminase [Candidatus Saccharimonadales bacterium]